MVYNNFLINTMSTVSLYLARSYCVFKSTLAWSTGLHEAASAGNLEQVECLLDDYWVHVDSVVYPNQDTAIMLAATKGHLAIVKCLVAHGADLKIPLKKNEQTILFLAVEKRHHALVEYLLTECGLASSVGDRNNESKTVVDIALGNVDIDMLNLLKKYGANVTSNDEEQVLREKARAEANSIEAVKYNQMEDHAIEVLQAFRPHQFKPPVTREEPSEDILESFRLYFFGPLKYAPEPKINLRKAFYEAVKSDEQALIEKMLELDYYNEIEITNDRRHINFPGALKRKFPQQEQLFKKYIIRTPCNCCACGGKDWIEDVVQKKFPILFQAVVNGNKAIVEMLMEHGAKDEAISLSSIAGHMSEKYRIDNIKPSELAKQLRFNEIANIIIESRVITNEETMRSGPGF